MNNIERFITYSKQLFDENFAVFDSALKCLYNEYIKPEDIPSVKEKIQQSDWKNDEGDHFISEIEFDNNTYYIVQCCKTKIGDSFNDDFLDRVAFLFDDLDYGIVILRDGKVCYRNNFLANYLGIPLEQKNEDQLYGMVSRETARSISEFVSNDQLQTAEVWLKLNNGIESWVTLGKSVFAHYRSNYTVISLMDFTEEKKQQEQNISEIEYLNRTLESIQEAVIILDKENKITLFNKNAERFSGKTREEVMYKNIYNEIYIEDVYLNPLRYWERESSNEQVVLVTKDGLNINLKMSVSNIYAKDTSLIGKVVVLNDVSEVKRREAEILYLSYHDVLTGLYNRTFFEEEIKRLDTARQLPLALIMGDVNGLKLTNDVFGHIAGDELLRNVADILKNAARNEDIIARWGGDEFIILLPRTNEDGAHSLMERINQQFLLQNDRKIYQSFAPSISLGYGVKKQEVEDIYDVLKIAESNMYKRKMLSKESVYSSVITSMKTALYEKSNETEDHTNRLYDYCKLMYKHYEFTKDEMNDMELLCMLHDIGKIGIHDTILKKPGPLTDEEWISMKKHSEIGFRIAQATPELSKVALYILYHHERFDGTGYPKGLKSYEIPLINRILSVADAFDAMTHDRTYRKAMSKEEALQELIDNKNSQFDPNIVDVFIEELKKGSI